MTYDAIIIGGGAAGLFCALTAGQRGRRVLVIEHNAEVGRKILISGGGRCNFTNREVRPENFISQNPHFCRSALARYTPDDFISVVKRHRIAYFEKTLGQLFCRGASRQIVDMLLDECRRAKVEIHTSCSVTSIDHAAARHAAFAVETTHGTSTAHDLVVACGGLSFPKIGATGLGYDIARRFGHKIVETRPSLVALTLSEKAFPALAGISLPADVSCGRHRFSENLLFTHRGLSGPAILQISNYWRRSTAVDIDLAPTIDVAALLSENRRSTRKTANFLSQYLPQRIVNEFLPETTEKRLDQLSNADIDAIANCVNGWQAHFGGTEGYDRAEVTLGGVSTSELSSATMESIRVKGLRFIGEVVDVTGWLGGYNFQWAWSSGYAAGNAI